MAVSPLYMLKARGQQLKKKVYKIQNLDISTKISDCINYIKDLKIS